MNKEEFGKLQRRAVQWIRENKKILKESFCSPDIFPREDNPVTIFMAGTPGAGKTEFSKSLLEDFKTLIVRIDADEIREMMRDIGYDGSNADCFQKAVTAAVSNLYLYSIKNGQSVLIDGTFAYANWRDNVQRSITLGRPVEIYYLYQDPVVAWGYCKIRELKQGRVVPIAVFIKDYTASIENVTAAKREYKQKLTLYFAKNNYQKKLEYIKINVDDIEKLLPKVYNETELKVLLSHDKEII